MRHATPLPLFQHHNILNEDIDSKEINNVSRNGDRNEVDIEIGSAENLTGGNGIGPSASNFTISSFYICSFDFC